MKVIFYRFIFLSLFCGLCLALLLSCAAQIEGSVDADGSAAMSVSVSLEPRMTSLIRSFAAAGGQAGGQNVIDAPSISQSMSNAPGISGVSLRNTSPSALEGSVRISNINSFLSAGDSAGFISFQQGRAGGNCVINITSSNGPAILAKLSPEISDYLSALMAPLATGEEMTKAEYLALVTSVYSRGVSDEIAGSRIRASIGFPGQITAVRGGTFSGRRANFDIPLLDLLVLETPLSYEVRWN